MQVVENYPDGLFSWVDLWTSDGESAKAFYSGLFGWEFEDLPTDMGPVYTMYRIKGFNVAGMSVMPPDMLEQGMPPVWTSYVSCGDVDAVSVKVNEAGGKVTMPPMDVMEEGRMAMIQDPTGAVLGLWQPRNHIGAQLVNIPNALVWNELQTRDVESAKPFYHTVFGWTHDVDPNGYVTFFHDGRVQAGMLLMDETWDKNITPNWTPYFMVEDVETSAEKVKKLGGKVLVPVTPVDELGRFSVIMDPQGGAFTIMQFEGEVTPPPGY